MMLRLHDKDDRLVGEAPVGPNDFRFDPYAMRIAAERDFVVVAGRPFKGPLTARMDSVVWKIPGTRGMRGQKGMEITVVGLDIALEGN